MKFNYKILLGCLSIASCMISCDSMESIHEKYYELAERVYIGKPEIQVANSGFNRAEIKWKINLDPKLEYCTIYWNKRKDSMNVEPDYTDTVMTQIVNLPEGKYILEMTNWGSGGERSLSDEVSVETFGEKYQSTLVARPVFSIDGGKAAVIHWGSIENCVYVQLTYTNKDGEQKTIKIDSDEYETKIPDYRPGDKFSYVCYFLPVKDAIDVVASQPYEGTFPE